MVCIFVSSMLLTGTIISPQYTYITKRLRQIRNAWRLWFQLSFVFTAQWLGLGAKRCSLLNAALALGWHQRLKASVFTGFFSSFYT